MKMMKKSIALLFAILSVVCLFTGCSNEKDKEFTTSSGVSVTLTDAFALNTDTAKKQGFDAVYISDYAACAILTESISSLEDIGYSEMNEKEYAELLAKLYNDGTRNMNGESKNEATGLESLTYTASNSGKSFYYFTVVKKNSTNYVTVTFWCMESDKDKYQSCFEKWAKTIKC